MSLRRKFILLLVFLGLAVAANLGTVVWSISFLERELAAPLKGFQEVLTGLSEVKRLVGDIHAGLVAGPGQGSSRGPMVRDEPGPEPPRDSAAVEQFEGRAREVLAALDRLEANESYLLRAGLSTTRNLRERVAIALEGARHWYQTGDLPDPGERRRLIESYFILHELIERIERRNLDELGSTVTYGAGLRWYTLVILGASALGVALALWDAAAFLGRWAVQPVARLRVAAERLAAGDFAHRIEITSRDEIGELSGEVNHMAATIARMQAERIERERLAAVGEVVRRIVHNLRNPLAGIRSLAEYARGEAAPDSELHESQDRIMQTVDRFEGWLGGLLSATRPLELNPETVEVGPWLAGVVEMHRAAATSRGVTLRLDTANAPQIAQFDSRHLEQALVALVVNAIEASPRGGSVEVAAEGADEAGAWQIRVTDQGPGVPDELRDKIFRPYFTTKREGSGIGLAVAHQVVAQHGGRILVGDRVADRVSDRGIGSGVDGSPGGAPGSGRGAEFRVVLPSAVMPGAGQGWPPGAGDGENSGH